MNKRQSHKSSFKSTVAEICAFYKISATCVHKWRKKAIENFDYHLFEGMARSLQ